MLRKYLQKMHESWPTPVPKKTLTPNSLKENCYLKYLFTNIYSKSSFEIIARSNNLQETMSGSGRRVDLPPPPSSSSSKPRSASDRVSVFSRLGTKSGAKSSAPQGQINDSNLALRIFIFNFRNVCAFNFQFKWYILYLSLKDSSLCPQNSI